MKETGQETATLSFGPVLEDLVSRGSSKQALSDFPECTDDDPSYIMIILSQDGTDVVGTDGTPFRVDLAPNQDFTVEVPELELTPGDYSLDYFAVYNSAGDLIWLAPNGGIFSSYFNDPLPMAIDLNAGVKKYVEVSVMCFDNRFVNEYGYLFFELDAVEAIEFCIFGNYCDETGRHYPAAFSVDVWTYLNGEPGSQLYSDLSNTVTMNGDGDYAGTTVCVALPDTAGQNEYYFEITLLNSDAYGNVTEEVIRSGVITDDNVRDLFVGDDSNEYYHFREGDCNLGDSPDLFEEGGGNGGGNGGGECDPNDPTEECELVQRNFNQNYFTLQSGNFIAQDLPSSNSDLLEILQIRGNTNILAGGSNRINVVASSNTEEIVVGVQGQEGFYTLQTTEGENTSEVSVDLNLLISQQAQDSFIIVFYPGDGEGNFGEPQTLEVTRQEAGTGLLQVSLAWDQPNDVDLHLIEPDGERIFYGNTSSANGGELDVDSNAACSIDGINNENIFYEDTSVPNGEYEVQVDLYTNCGVSGNTNYTIVAYYDGELIVPSTGSNPFEGEFTPADDDGNQTTVMTFDIQDGATTRAMERKSMASKASDSKIVYKFNYDKENKVFENFNPKNN